VRAGRAPSGLNALEENLQAPPSRPAIGRGFLFRQNVTKSLPPGLGFKTAVCEGPLGFTFRNPFGHGDHDGDHDLAVPDQANNVPSTQA
jgi:hypothetical protein